MQRPNQDISWSGPRRPTHLNLRVGQDLSWHGFQPTVGSARTGPGLRDFSWNGRGVQCIVILMLLSSRASYSAATGADNDRANRPQPNVVLIMTDDQGYGDLSCHGNPILQTPHLDAFYRESVRLTNFHVDPTCSPTRAALMTGRYSTRTGVWHTVMGRNMPRKDELMMPRVFANSGYRTAIFGKWHLGDVYPFRPQDRGFQHVIIHGGGGVGQIPDYWGNDYFDDTYLQNSQPNKFTGYCTDVFFREALKFIEANRDRPFFVYLPTNAPHGPFLVAEKYSRLYQEKVGKDRQLADFYGMIANIDENVGIFLDKLKEWELERNTIVIFMTDNGTSRGVTFTDYRGNSGVLVSGFNAGMRGRKGSPYEGGHRVPCFFRWPAGGLGGGRDVPQLAAHIDLLPTLIELCRLKPPSGIQFDGVSLAGLLTNENRALPARTLHVHHQELPDPVKYRYACTMIGQWRLISRRDDVNVSNPNVGGVLPPRFELYDLAADPGQQTNVIQVHPELVRSMQNAYEEWWDGLAQRFDEDAAIIVGNDRQNPASLTCFDWHGSRHWWQKSVRAGFEGNGDWVIDVSRAGTYAIVLRRWPEETNASITASVDGGKAILPVTARIQFGDLEQTLPIAEGTTSVRFEMTLPAGKTRLTTWLTDKAGRSRGAYYADIELISPSAAEGP